MLSCIGDKKLKKKDPLAKEGYILGGLSLLASALPSLGSLALLLVASCLRLVGLLASGFRSIGFNVSGLSFRV